MNFSIYIPIIVTLVLLYIVFYRSRQLIVAKRIMERRRKGDKTEMLELAKRFIDKECLISSFDGSRQYEGVIKEVTDGAILIEKDGKLEAINLDFVIRIREYPRKKNGKKKSVVLD